MIIKLNVSGVVIDTEVMTFGCAQHNNMHSDKYDLVFEPFTDKSPYFTLGPLEKVDIDQFIEELTKE